MTVYILSCVPADALKKLLYESALTWPETDLKVSEDPEGRIPTILKTNKGFEIKEPLLELLGVPIIITDLWFSYTEVMLDKELEARLWPYDDITISRQRIISMVQAVDWTQQAERYRQKQVKDLLHLS